ncbi:MAG: aminotransferase class I/II-fold pyridoxal phosphate-dependent enzyme [Clostridiales bacterium]|nr:MAG: aminotransferase class I/II-fold pyridoxal phosphate-dependent enzyme [Clostridiales bacterium]
MLYPDPECTVLNEKFAKLVGVEKDEVMAVNGSDEIFEFRIFSVLRQGKTAVFPDITYGFFMRFSPIITAFRTEKNSARRRFLKINISDYFNANAAVFIANPNAPTGIALTLGEVEAIVKNNPENIVVIDEAYVDFGGESAVSLIHTYDNLFGYANLFKIALGGRRTAGVRHCLQKPYCRP